MSQFRNVITDDRTIRIFVQARLASRRLPAKALLPLGGIPLVALCAMRASSAGYQAQVLTSNDRADDFIVQVLEKFAIPYFRGPQTDVLKRFHFATRDLSPDSIVVRLTGDNPFPDGLFLNILIDRFLERRCKYLRTHVEGGQPGLSAEVFYAESLREAESCATSEYEREHVTPWIIRKHGCHVLNPAEIDPNYGSSRCTLDTFEDFVRLKWAFDQVTDPVRASLTDLYQALAAYPDKPKFLIPRSQRAAASESASQSALTLGTAQLGLDYGINNKAGKPSRELAAAILSEAYRHGVTCFDTARAYGDAETVLGSAFENCFHSDLKIVTKLDPLEKLTNMGQPSRERIVANVDDSVFRSLRELKVRQLDTLLLHRWEHYHRYEGLIWSRLLELREMGIVKHLGASICNVPDALEALEDENIRHLQIPFNLADYRWRNEEFLSCLSRRPDVVIHARSPFLQGLLVGDEDCWPNLKGVNAKVSVRRLEQLVRDLGRKSRADLCLAYVRSYSWISSIVMGVDSVEQLNENLELFQAPALTAKEADRIHRVFGEAPEIMLDPSCWGNK